jgi:ABC-type proline/glycine betaine transport system permease subunit
VIGVGLAIAIGVVLGVIIGWYRRIAMILNPFVTALYSTPRVALVPLVLIWFGLGMRSKVFIVFINAVFPVLINTIGGVRAIDHDLLKAARAYCASDWQIFTTVVIPGAVPFILTGVRQAVALGLIGVVVGEMFGGSEGIGYMVNYGGQTFQTDTVFLGVTIIALSESFSRGWPSGWRSVFHDGDPRDSWWLCWWWVLVVVVGEGRRRGEAASPCAGVEKNGRRRVGIGSSHGPLLSTPPEQWDLRAKADKENKNHWFRGKTYDYRGCWRRVRPASPTRSWWRSAASVSCSAGRRSKPLDTSSTRSLLTPSSSSATISASSSTRA